MSGFLQPVKGGIEGAFLEPEISLAPGLEFFHDLVTVHRLLLQETQEQGVGAAFQ